MKFIFNADDFGSHPAVSRGIIQSVEQGVVRSTTVMANMVDDDSLAALASLPGVSVGVHLNLTKGKPLSNTFSPDWLEGGRFSREKMYFPEGLPLLSERAIREELEAQVDRIAQVGIAVTHLDSHQNIHASVNVLHVAAEIAQERGLAMRSLSPQMDEYLDWKGVRHPAVLIFGFFGKNNIGELQLLALLNSARQRTRAGVVEVMCHPGLTAGLPRRHTDYYEERELELATLCSSGLKAWLKDNGCQLADYGDV